MHAGLPSNEMTKYPLVIVIRSMSPDDPPETATFRVLSEVLQLTDPRADECGIPPNERIAKIDKIVIIVKADNFLLPPSN